MSRRFIFLLFSLLSLEWKHVCITILIIICQCIQFTWRGHPKEQKTQGASHKSHSVVYVTIASSPSVHRRLLFSFASVSRMTGTLGILYMINYVIGNPPPPPTNWPNLYLFLFFLLFTSAFFHQSSIIKPSSHISHPGPSIASPLNPNCVPPSLGPSCWLSADSWGCECPATLCIPWGSRWWESCWSESGWGGRPRKKPHSRSVRLSVSPCALVWSWFPRVNMLRSLSVV